MLIFPGRKLTPSSKSECVKPSNMLEKTFVWYIPEMGILKSG